MVIPRTRRVWFAAAAAVAALVAGVSLAAQFASGTTLVEVYATVTDSKGGSMTDLRAADFVVLEDGVAQRVSAFAAGDVPLSVALAVDRSVSMAGQPLALAKSAARTFLGQLRPADRFMLVAVSSQTEVVAPLSTDRASALQALLRLEPWSTTALNDAIIACVDAIQPASERRAAIILSDAVDRYSQATEADVLDHVRRTDVLVYPVAIGKARSTLFPQLAALTGARSFQLRDFKELEKALTTIADELHHQYLLGYTPVRPPDPAHPEWRAIMVKVNRPGAKVRARDGYVSR